MSLHDLFVENLDLLDRIIRATCYRNLWDPGDQEDFASWAKLRIIDNDYRILRQFEGKASLPTYLTTVVQNLFRDYRIHKWGKWRPSAAAQRLGPRAVRLETLVSRDGHTVNEAVEILANRGHRLEPEEIDGILAAVPTRFRRREQGLEVLEVEGREDGVHGRVEEAERLETRERVAAALERAMARLEGEDRLVLRLHFADGVTIARISRMLGLEQKPLYRRVHRCLRELRDGLESSGVELERVVELFGWHGLDLEIEELFDAPSGIPDSGTSDLRGEKT